MVSEDNNDGEDNVYREGSREDLVDDDEISPEEEAFMKGYDDADEYSDDDEDKKDKDDDEEEDE